LIRLEDTARKQDKNSRTAVHAAAEAGFKDTLKPLLLESNYDVNQQDYQGRSMVHWAASCDWQDIFSTIVETADVNLTKRDHDGEPRYTSQLCADAPTYSSIS